MEGGLEEAQKWGDPSGASEREMSMKVSSEGSRSPWPKDRFRVGGWPFLTCLGGKQRIPVDFYCPCLGLDTHPHLPGW